MVGRQGVNQVTVFFPLVIKCTSYLNKQIMKRHGHVYSLKYQLIPAIVNKITFPNYFKFESTLDDGIPSTPQDPMEFHQQYHEINVSERHIRRKTCRRESTDHHTRHSQHTKNWGYGNFAGIFIRLFPSPFSHSLPQHHLTPFDTADSPEASLCDGVSLMFADVNHRQDLINVVKTCQQINSTQMSCGDSN